MSKAKILVVEDERIVAEDIQSRLESLGYSVAGVASTGEEAIQRALRTDPDLILMDILLKGSVDGIQAADEITKKLDVPVVYLTAYADEITLQRAKITGPFGYIVKPFEQRNLHTTIETALFKHKMEKKLKESEERYRTLQENLPLGVFRVTPGGRIISVNPTLTSLLGYESEKELLETPVIDLYEVPEHRTEFRKRLKSENVVTNYEVRLVRKNGEKFWASLNVRAIRDDAGIILFHDGTLRDITELKRTEKLKNEYFRNLIFLSKTAMDFVTQEPGENIYSYIAEKTKEVIPGSQIVAVISLDEETNVYQIRSIVGLGKRLKTVLNLLGKDPIGLRFPLTAEIKNLMKRGKLRRVSADFDRHSGGAIPKGVSQTLRKILQMGPIYIMGILKGDKLLGSITVVMQKGRNLTNRDVVEAFINQAAVALLRKQTDEALHSSEHRYRELFHKIPSGVIVLEAIGDGSKFIVKEFNKAGEKISKIGKELVIGEPVTEVFPGIIKSGLVEVIKKVWKTGKPEYVPAWFYKDARLSGWRESHVYKLPSGEIVSMYQDVTDRIQAQEALRNSEERHRSVVETSNDAIVTIDDEGPICFWNRAAEMMFGYGKDEMINKPLTHIMPERFRSKFLSGMMEMRKRGSSKLVGKQMNLIARHSDGHEFSIELSIFESRVGAKKYYTGFIRDVTERKRMEEAILRAKQEWERTFDTVPDLIAILDTGHRVIQANRSLAERLKRNVKELIGRHFYELIYGTMNPPEEHQLPRIWENGTELRRELHNEHLDGYFSFTLTPLYDYSERLIGTVFVGTDITEQKRVDEAMKRQAMIDQAEHIFSSIRHEMGNALNTLKTTLTVLSKNYLNFTPEKRETYFIRCLDTFKVSERLLRVLKEYQKFNKVELTPVFIDRFLKEKSGLFVDLARHSDVECRVELSFSDIQINIDPDALIQVLLNVVDNAISATQDTDVPFVTIKCHSWKDWVIITVADNGIGIPEEELPKVFTPLYTTKPEGSGLGMAIVQKKMMQMGGEAKIESEPNEGTTVELWLPLYSEKRVTELHAD